MAGVVGAHKGRVACGIGVARRAYAARIAVVHTPEIVSKRRPQPTRRGVAGRASGGDDSNNGGVGGGVIRHIPAQRCGALPLSRMAAVTIRRWHCAAGVAKVAGHGEMRSCQRKAGRAVIENRAEPGSRRVARRAGCRIPRSDVIGHRPAKRRGALPLSDVAAVAVSRQRPAVVSIHVAQRAGHGRMSSGQRKGCRAVIEGRCRPIGRGVADRTIRRKPRRNMIGNRAAERRRALPVSQMAAVAGRRIQSVIVADVTRGARRRAGRNVHSRQGKPRRAVVECCRKETHRRVASGAARYRECGCGSGVRRIRRPLPAAAVVCV